MSSEVSSYDVNGIEFTVTDKRRNVFLDSFLTFALSLSAVMALAGSADLSVGIYALLHVFIFSALLSMPVKNGKYVLLLIMSLVAVSLLFPIVREGGKYALNAVFIASESRNFYVYESLPSYGDESSYEIFLLVLSTLITAFASICVRKRAGIFVFAVIAIYEAYFGIVPSVACSIFVLCSSVASSVESRNLPMCLLVMAAVCIVAAIFSSILPSYNATIEEASEYTRDLLGEVFVDTSDQVIPEGIEESTVKRQQRLGELAAGSESGELGAEDIEKRTETEREISIPVSIDYIKTALIALLILMLFVLPFLPFSLIDKRKKQAERMREGFVSEDNSEAILAMFPYMMKWLSSRGIYVDGELFSEASQSVYASMGESFGTSFECALKIWQKCFYSEHGASNEERDEVKSTLEAIENKIYTEESAFGKFKLKYVYCLKV